MMQCGPVGLFRMDRFRTKTLAGVRLLSVRPSSWNAPCEVWRENHRPAVKEVMSSLTVEELLSQHVDLEVASLDRLYLGGYIPDLVRPNQVARFIKEDLKKPVPCTQMLAPLTHGFVAAIESFAKENGVELITFKKKDEKDKIAQEHLRAFGREEGVYLIGKAQEKAHAIQTSNKKNHETGKTYPWLYMGTSYVNHYYFYIWDRDFGPVFIKFCSYFPYPMRVCLNGHEYAKCQLTQRGIGYEPLANGFASCSDPRMLQKICDTLSDVRIEGMIRKWLKRLPNPFRPNRQSRYEWQRNYEYEFSMFQAEFSLTQVFSRPAYGRRFFEEVIREHVDLGRPEYVQLVFGRRVTKRTPGLFRTRLMNYGTIPTFRVYYKNTHIKQYFKERLGLRTETTINNTYDFRIGRRLCNFSRLREIGLQANRRLLRVQRLSHDPAVGAEVFETLSSPLWVGDQRVARLTFSDKRVQVLMSCLIQCAMRPDGFRNAEMRVLVAQLMGQDPATYKPGKMTYDLRRLRLHGLIEREEGSHRYHLTEAGLRQAMVYVRTHKRVVVPLLSEPANLSKATPELRKAQAAIDKYIKAQKAAKEAA